MLLFLIMKRRSSKMTMILLVKLFLLMMLKLLCCCLSISKLARWSNGRVSVKFTPNALCRSNGVWFYPKVILKHVLIQLRSSGSTSGFAYYFWKYLRCSSLGKLLEIHVLTNELQCINLNSVKLRLNSCKRLFCICIIVKRNDRNPCGIYWLQENTLHLQTT